MDPALLVALSGLGRGIAQAGQAYGAAKAGFSPAAEKRLRELERMEEMNALGLTGDEREMLQRNILDPQRAIQSQRLEQQQALLGGQTADGRGLRDMLIKQEKDDIMLADAAQKIATLDLQRKRQLEQELLGLSQAEARSDAALQTGLLTLLGEGVAGAADVAALREAEENRRKRRFNTPEGYKYRGIGEQEVNIMEEF